MEAVSHQPQTSRDSLGKSAEAAEVGARGGCQRHSHTYPLLLGQT